MNGWIRVIALVVLGLLCGSGNALAGEISTVSVLGDPAKGEGWRGLEPGDGGATLVLPGEAVFRYPDGEQGWAQKGFRKEHDGTRDWRDYAGLRLDLELPGGGPTRLTVTLGIPEQIAREDLITGTTAEVVVQGEGRQSVLLPWDTFDFNQVQPAFLKFAKQLTVRAEPVEGGTDQSLVLHEVAVIRASRVAVRAEVLGRAGIPNQPVQYLVAVTNTTDQPQSIALSFEKYGWETMTPSVEPTLMQLEPGESGEATVNVVVSERIPAGGRETQRLKAVANGHGNDAAELVFTTTRRMNSPYLLHTAKRWEGVRQKAKDYDWADAEKDRIVAQAAAWQVPEIAAAPDNLKGHGNFGPYLFRTQVEKDLMVAGVAYQLTGKAEFAEKIRTFVLRLSDPDRGYPVTLRGCHQSLVQEGHFFQHIAMAYDMALPSGIFTDEDIAQIEHTFRLYIETIDFECSFGAVSNWHISMMVGALYCALTMQDFALAERYYSGPGGVLEQISHGVMSDGWWYECSISYNVWCASEFTQVALAMEPFGYNLRDARVPIGYSFNFGMRPWEAVNGLYGQSFQKWGPITRNYVTVKDLWDSLPRFADYRGVMFAVNDATERRLGGDRSKIGGRPFELAYMVYPDPAYATIIQQGDGERDLIYGVPELPPADAVDPPMHSRSAYADNAGVVMLRSQTPDRPIREQIQAVLHYGTHGGFHGHFDRTQLLHLSRYGRSFYNPEMVWFGYASYMYKFYVQNSTSKNMVVVDRKMQEPVESDRLLFHTGELFQATAVETNARWSTPPYGGMIYPEQGIDTVQGKAWAEGRFLPKPENEPEYGSVTQFTEPIRQRRVMIVTDDYVVLADQLDGQQEHTFENLFQMKGFKGLEAAEKKLIRHDGQWDDNPVLDAQFVTDANWYAVTAPAKSSFEMRWGEGADNAGTRTPYSEDGLLKLDVHTLWPPKQEIMVATAPEDHAVRKQLWYSVKGDGQVLAEGKFGAWILGKADIDVPLSGLAELVLETRTQLTRKPTVFWGDVRIVAADGREIALSELPTTTTNVKQPPAPGQDYFGGPIKIVGESFESAQPGQPESDDEPAVILIDLSAIDAVRFRGTLGGDYPLGDESQRRKTYAVRSDGKSARFLTVIEPYENESVIREAVAIDDHTVRVTLKGGRVQTLTIDNLDGDGSELVVELEEGGSQTRKESTY